MRRVAAGRVVTGVANALPFLERAIFKFKGDNMRPFGLVPPNDGPVPIWDVSS